MIVTEYQTRIHLYNPELKEKSKQRDVMAGPAPKEFKVRKSNNDKFLELGEIKGETIREAHSVNILIR